MEEVRGSIPLSSEGTTYYFRSTRCHDMFDSDPVAYSVEPPTPAHH